MAITFRNHNIHKEAILIREFEGAVTVNEIIASWEYLLEHDLLQDTTQGVVNILTQCELKMNMSSFDKLIAYLKSKPQFSKIKLAVICTDPKMIVFPMVGQVREAELRIRPFSTIEAAVDWIILG